MADCDALTGLWTRGTLDVELPVSLSHAATDKRPLSVVMIDLDHFKRINDTHGHQRGDAVLSAVGACIDSVAAGKGKIYRYGGEEILMLLPNHTPEEAVAVAERVRRQIESAPIAVLRGSRNGRRIRVEFDFQTVPAMCGVGIRKAHLALPTGGRRP